MSSSQKVRRLFFLLAALVCALTPAPGRAQAALFLEAPYGFFGALVPTGHSAIYFQNICAETPVKLRRCQPGELGVVIARYQGIASYDWIAIPLVPYLYSVEELAQAPQQVDRPLVQKLRNQYHDAHLTVLGENIPPGGFRHGGWTELVGVAYERRLLAYRFRTTPEQDDAVIAQLNRGPNKSRFSLVFNNCADFSRNVLNLYFPKTFKRGVFPDAGLTTPKQVVSNLVHYGRKHRELELTVYEIPQIRGYRRHSGANLGVAESLATTGYAVPLVFINPYLLGGLFVDYVARGRFHTHRSQIETLTPDLLPELAGLPPLQKKEAPAALSLAPVAAPQPSLSQAPEEPAAIANAPVHSEKDESLPQNKTAN
jgi:hypothetical protein